MLSQTHFMPASPSGGIAHRGDSVSSIRKEASHHYGVFNGQRW
jgi:hypothetical protein